MLCTLHTLFHQLDITVPHNTAGGKVPLQLAEILGEAGQLLGLRSTPSRAPAYMAATRTHTGTREGTDIHIWNYIPLSHWLVMNYFTFFLIEAVSSVPRCI